MSDLQMPDLGGAPMPGEPLNLDFLRSLDDNSSSRYPSAPQVQSFGSKATGSTSAPPVVEGQSTKILKPNIQPIARDDFSAEAMERRRAEETQRMLQEQQWVEAEQHQQRHFIDVEEEAEPLNPQESDSFWQKYQLLALWVGLAAIILTLYLQWQKGDKINK